MRHRGRGGRRGGRRTKRVRRRERVNTHLASTEFRYADWGDLSPDAASLQFVTAQRVTRLEFTKAY